MDFQQACLEGDLPTVDRFLARSKACGEDSIFAMRTAFSMGNVEMLSHLISQGNNPNKAWGIYPENEEKAIEVVDLLVSRGGDINFSGYDDITPYLQASMDGHPVSAHIGRLIHN